MPKLTPLLLVFGITISLCGVLVGTFLQARSPALVTSRPADGAEVGLSTLNDSENTPENTLENATQTGATGALSLDLETDLEIDSLRHPPLSRTFAADGEDYRLLVAAVDGWETPNALAALYAGDTLQWQTPIPQQYGPRYALVTSAGTVLMVDEFINISSEYAIALFNPQGILIAQHSFDNIQQALDIPPAEIAQKATSGWWVSSPPELIDDQEKAQILTGGTRLEIDLTTGELIFPAVR